MEYYRCGKIMTTHGIKGDLKVKVTSDFNRFFKGSKLYIYHNEEYIPVEVEKASDFGKYLLVSFKGLQDINLVSKYHLDEIYVSEEDREALEEDEYYYSDLVGCEVYNQENLFRGVVEEIKEMPQCDYLYISYNNMHYYVPFINEFVLEVTDKIIIQEIEGLIREN
ncbi:MAG: ribosome maturation factor RimM [Anaeroplasmataceae bacterium]|nr:ribosome maturation factor RimM [Anaeroplasmataceae bacterium]MDE6414965.1 ribosome maturation factor RimM [Anaeroplasmataceae bacterium]